TTGPSRPGRDEFESGGDGAEVGVAAEPLAEPEERLLGAQNRRRVVPPGTDDGAEQDGVGVTRALELRGRQWLAARVDGGTADHAARERQLEVVARRDRLEDGDRLGRHLGADPVTGKDGDRRARHVS